MRHISGTSRQQIQISSLEDKTASDNPPEAWGRFIEAFVEYISLEVLGFTVQTIISCRPSFDTKLFLKVYLYGYINGHRSSIKIKKKPTLLHCKKKEDSKSS
jgi:hypothetical protein